MANDLAGAVRTRRALGPDDPLPFLLNNPRELRTVEHNDGVWLKVTDPSTAFSARTFRTDDELVIGVCPDLSQPTSMTETFVAGSNGVDRSQRQPDLFVTESALGPLLVGSIPTSRLAAGRRIVGDPNTLVRADALFGHSPGAHSQIPL